MLDLFSFRSYLQSKMYDTQSESRNLFFASIPINSFSAEQRNKNFDFNLNKKKHTFPLFEFLHTKVVFEILSHFGSLFLTFLHKIKVYCKYTIYEISNKFFAF